MDVFVVKYFEKLCEKSYVVVNFQCRLWYNGQRLKLYGQIKVKFLNLEWYSYFFVKLFLMIKFRFIFFLFFDCLYLCYNCLCINLDYFLFELYGVNMQWVNCMFEGVCRQYVNYFLCFVNFYLNE